MLKELYVMSPHVFENFYSQESQETIAEYCDILAPVMSKGELIKNTEILNDETREFIHKKIEQIAHGIGAALDVECVVTYDFKYPPVTNDSQVTTEVVNSLEEIFPDQLVEVEEPLMGGEDYAYYLYEAPGTFLFLSNPSNIEGKFHGHHHAKFDVDESLFYMATAAFVKVALDYLN
ncbi:amidohydrolase [Ruoffia tabacinasalis]|uniref:Amidohydrolase n=1 Tax=Ruoffia tabacinasalis TaxID=87458 RepID=A0A5R9DSJ9_9LACT|nr:M20/M25/M40 family metallo-hydrolase [Ruoffia tabacinasalis]TLQ39675.1 amidohydrolase [Ruoffia tabacinasalis]